MTTLKTQYFFSAGGETASAPSAPSSPRDSGSWPPRSEESHPKVIPPIKCDNQVALRRQQAQEEAEARQLGVEILKPGDRADLVMGSGGVIRRQQAGEAEAGDNEVGDSDSEKVEMENRDQKQVKVDTTDLPEQGLD